jgi:hypothetical protein
MIPALQVLLVTELLDIRNALVGDPGETGLSVEQRRRLSIGVELVSNPSVMVCFWARQPYTSLTISVHCIPRK